MASPFRIFRKNQKLWMAGITIMAIIAFVFMGNPMQSLARMGGSIPSVVKTRFGNLTQYEVNDLRGKRVMLSRFLQSLAFAQRSNEQAARNVNGVIGLLGPDTEDEAIHRWVYARTAEAMGVVVDNKAVNDLLTLLTAGTPEPQKLITDVLRSDQRGMMNQDVLMRIMREQLLALRLTQLGHQIR